MMTIGARREERIPVAPGPGTYSPEKGDGMTLVRSPAFDFSKQPERPNAVESNPNGPGSYDAYPNFGEDLKM